MTYYTISQKDWLADYRVFYDGLFILAFVLTILCAIIMVSLFIGYILKDYNAVKPAHWSQQQSSDKYVYECCGPQYLPFMEKVDDKRP